MKSILNICVLIILTTLTISAQSSTVVNTSPQKAECVPTKECAEKMGMTLEECKAVCEKVCNGKSALKDKSNASNVNLVTIASTKEKTSCCSTIEECAKKMGMTVEECKASCGSFTQANSTKVASASLESETTNTKDKSAAPKTCAKTSAKCCSKKN